MDRSRADSWEECVKAHASSYMCSLWQQRPILPRRLQGGFVWQTAVAYTSGFWLTVRVTSRRVPKLFFFFFFNVLDLSFDEETVVSSHSFCSDFPRNACEGVVIDQVPKLWWTVNTAELMMNSLASTPVGRTPPRFSAALSAPGGQLLWRCMHWSINCSSQLGILESSAPWQSEKGIPKSASHRDQLEGFSTVSGSYPQTFNLSGVCYGLNVCILTKTHRVEPYISKDGIWRWLWEDRLGEGFIFLVFGPWEWCPHGGISVLSRRVMRKLAFSLHVLPCKGEDTCKSDTKPAKPLILDFPASRTVILEKRTFLLLKPASLMVFLL